MLILLVVAGAAVYKYSIFRGVLVLGVGCWVLGVGLVCGPRPGWSRHYLYKY